MQIESKRWKLLLAGSTMNKKTPIYLLPTSAVSNLASYVCKKQKAKAVKTMTKPSRQTSRLFSKKHTFYRVWENCSLCTCRRTSDYKPLAQNEPIRFPGKLRQTWRDWLPHPSVTYSVPPPLGLVKSQQSAVPAIPLFSSQQQGAELKNIVWHLGARCWEQINLIRLELSPPDSPNLQHNNWGAESPQSRPSFTLLCYYHLLLPHRKTHGSAKHSSFG